jgi:hypothetical protein
MGKKDSMKGLVLASVFFNCYLGVRELTVFELLDADQMSSSHYGRKPQVLSNTLLRYYKLGLLYRRGDFARGHPYSYNLTEKGFKRFMWMCKPANSGRYLYRGKDFLKPLVPRIITDLKKMIYDAQH